LYLILTFLILLMSYELDDISPYFRVISVLFQIVYFVYHVHVKKKRLSFGAHDKLLLAFLAWYSIFFFMRRYDPISGLASGLFLLLIPINLKASGISIKSTKLPQYFLVIYIIGFIIPAILSPDFSLGLGTNYNIKNVLFFNSTLDIHLFGTLTLIVSLLHKDKKTFLIVLALTLFVFFTFGRRGPYFNAVIVLLASAFLSQKIRYRAIRWLGLFFWSIPFFWETISQLLVRIFSLDIVQSVVPRNNIEQYESATGRKTVWLNALDFLKNNVDLEWLWGYGDSNRLGITNVLTHMHNLVFELFFQVGILGLLIFWLLVLRSYRNSEKQFWVLLSWILMLGSTESIVYGYNLATVVLIVVIVLITTPIREKLSISNT